ncbi:hypothetical protein [Pseudomonas sp. NW5]|uniref:hypothetical protein n=1 Tax=Pseudomonas sp. NW5 TaxID=2934934 RepID=UPI0020221B5C|nr:hypothetical protein [Pseudomonas sp. NW5]MCL7461693.1 hypothetical protein [Pseudomonas sp. NW5]
MRNLLPAQRERRIIDGFSPVLPRVTPAMEINPILNAIKDLTERTQAIRGYL